MTQENTFEKIDVLLVDDRPANLLALESALASPAYHFIKAESGEEALKYLLHNEPALILMDVQMPGMDGFETASIIKKSERTRSIPIIFITALNKDERYTHKGYSTGAVDYIYKPLDIHVLRSKVAVFAEFYRKNQLLLRAERKLRDEERRDREREIAQLELKNLKREQIEQKKYRDLVEGIRHGIVWSADPQTFCLTFVSPSVESITGFSAETCIAKGDTWLENVHKDDKKKLLDAIAVARLEKTELRVEHRLLKADKDVVWLQTHIRENSKEDGTAELRGLSVDITKTKLAEERLRRHKKHSDFLAAASLILSESEDYRNAISRISDLLVPDFADFGLIHLHSEEPILKGDLKVLKGLPEQEMMSAADLGPRLFDLRTHGFHSAILAPIVARGKSIGKLAFVSKTPDRNWDEADISMIMDFACRAALAIDNNHLYRQAREAVRLRDDFLSIASHELRTPLTPLTLQVQALIRALTTGSLDAIQPERLERMLQSCDRQLLRLAKLIENLLDISRINTGKLTLDTEDFDLMELIHEVADRFQDQLKNARCEVRISGPDSLPVRWDRTRIEQVIVNLLINAMKYGAGQPISVKVASKNSGVSISVQDRGIGIAKEDQHRIFERFERAVSGKHIGGLGLGLFIVRQILEAHGGKVKLKSEVSRGSTFTAELPERITSKAELRNEAEAS